MQAKLALDAAATGDFKTKDEDMGRDLEDLEDHGDLEDLEDLEKDLDYPDDPKFRGAGVPTNPEDEAF